MLRRGHVAVLGSQIRLEDTAKELKQDLEADLGDGWVVAALAEFITDEGMLSPGELVEAGNDTSLAQLGADKVTSSIRDVCILDTKDHGNLALEVVEKVQGVVAVFGGSGRGVGGVIGTKGARMDICGEVGYASTDARIKSGTDGKVAAKAHSRSSNETSAGWEGEEMVNSGVRVGIVGLEGLFNLELVATVRVFNIILEGFRTGEVVVGRRGGNNVALACDLTGEAGNGTGYLVNLAKEAYTWEACIRISGNCWMKDKDSHGAVLAIGRRGDVDVRLLDQHFDFDRID